MTIMHERACTVHVRVITSCLPSVSVSSGGFAFVYEAQDVSGGKDYALKVR